MRVEVDTKLTTSHVCRWVRVINDVQSSPARADKIDQETYLETAIRKMTRAA